MEASGHCLCGAVSYVAGEIDTDFHTCHCGMCRKWSGGPVFATSVGNVKFEGEENISRYDSSPWAERGFCNRCGSNLFYHLKEADHYVLWVGTFDDQTPFRLTGEIYIDDKPAGYDFAGDHPRMTGEEFLASFQQS